MCIPRVLLLLHQLLSRQSFRPTLVAASPDRLPFISYFINYGNLKTLCDPLGGDFGISLSGNTADVNFTVTASGEVEVYVDWASTSNNGYSLDSLSEGTYVAKLLTLVTEGIQIWYNVSGAEPSCIRWDQTAPNANTVNSVYGKTHKFLSPGEGFEYFQEKIKRMKEHRQIGGGGEEAEGERVCSFPKEEFDASMGWFALTCNEGEFPPNSMQKVEYEFPILCTKPSIGTEP